MINKFVESDFKRGQFEGINLIEGKLMLCETCVDGIYTSSEINTLSFKALVASWNSKTNEHSRVELEVRVKSSIWSQWFSYGIWSDLGMNEGSIPNQKDDIARLSVDEIICKNECDVFQYRIKLTRKSIDVTSPSINTVYISVDVGPLYKDFKITNADIEVPMISQMLIKDIGSIICSPTSLEMVMDYYGNVNDIIDTSQGCFDNGAGIYGNWVYNVAYAGERGFEAYVDYCYDSVELLRFIQMGTPLIASIKTKQEDEIKNAPQAYPSGHLVVIRGFQKDDEDYIIVNDPASKTTKGVKRYYKLSEFLKAWNNIIYVIKPNRKNL
jgi:hypothetical protein